MRLWISRSAQTATLSLLQSNVCPRLRLFDELNRLRPIPTAQSRLLKSQMWCEKCKPGLDVLLLLFVFLLPYLCPVFFCSDGRVGRLRGGAAEKIAFGHHSMLCMLIWKHLIQRMNWNFVQDLPLRLFAVSNQGTILICALIALAQRTAYSTSRLKARYSATELTENEIKANAEWNGMNEIRMMNFWLKCVWMDGCPYCLAFVCSNGLMFEQILWKTYLCECN